MCEKKDIRCVPLENLKSLGFYKLKTENMCDDCGSAVIYYKDNMVVEYSDNDYDSHGAVTIKLDSKGKNLIHITFVSHTCFHIKSVKIRGRKIYIYENNDDFDYCETTYPNCQNIRKENEEFFREIVFKNLQLIKSLENYVPREVVEEFFGPIYKKKSSIEPGRIIIRVKKIKHNTK